MKNILKDAILINTHKQALGGVFLLSELATLFADPHKTSVYRRIGQLEKTGILERFIKGVYITSDFDVEILNQKICPQSYISLGSILSENLIIGTRPMNQLEAIKPGKTRIHRSARCVLRQFGIAEYLIFGYENCGGIYKATPEKALLDTFYLHQHGIEFHFDIYSDINWGRIDPKLTKEYLLKYKNPKFISFIQGVLSETT